MSFSIEQGVGLSVLEQLDTRATSRADTDRREFSWRTVFYGFLRSRRRVTRRTHDTEPQFTDYHHPWLFFLSIGIMLMSCADAFFTLQLLQRGAIEANPVMAVVIGKSTAVFATTKMLLTSIAILMLVFLAKTTFLKRIRAGLFLTFFFTFYAGLICYEFVYLISHF